MNRRLLLTGISAVLLPSSAQALFGRGLQRALMVQAYCAEAKVLFAAMTVQPSNARKALINRTILSLISTGVWSQLDVLYMLAAHDAQAARLNWKSPGTYDAIAVNSPAFATDRGYTGNGTSSRLRTQYTPSVNAVMFTRNSASAWIWSLTEGQSNIGDIGNVNGGRITVSPRSTTNLFNLRMNDGSATSVANSVGKGFMGGVRRGASATAAWRDNSELGTGSVASSVVPAEETWICGLNPTAFSTRQIAMAAIGASCAGKESAFYTSILPYMQGVGAAT